MHQKNEEMAVVVKNMIWDSAVYPSIIIDELWVPIRKIYRLVYNVDLAMWHSTCSVPEVDESGVPLLDGEGHIVPCPATKFCFAHSITYTVDETEDGNFVYQKVTRRDGVRGNVKAHQNDATKVKVTYVTRAEYEKFEREQRKLPEGQRSQRVLIRKMPAPTEEMISQIAEAAIAEFITVVLDFLLGFDFEEGRTPVAVDHRTTCAAAV